MPADFPPILDGHVDFLLSMENTGRDFLEESDQGHVDLPRARRGGLGGLFCSVFLSHIASETSPLAHTMKYLDDLFTIVDRSQGQVRLVRTADELDECLATGTFAMILHFEGAEPIGRSLRELRTWYEVGLRSLGLVHARPNLFGNGAPLSPTDPEGNIIPRPSTEPRPRPNYTMRGWGLPRGRYLPYKDTGLTQLGAELIKECEHLGILVDVSHMTDRMFWDTMQVVTKPVVATHSSVRAICDQKRNLTDDQIKAIARTGGTIGINFSTSFLRPDRQGDENTPLELLADHFDHVIKLVGDEHVSFGSDYDGGIRPPADVSDCSKLGNLMWLFKKRGYSDDRLERIANGNWRRVVREVWKSPKRAESPAAIA